MRICHLVGGRGSHQVGKMYISGGTGTKGLPMQETRVRSLGWEEPLEKGMATHSSILAWRVPMDRGAWRATVHGITQSRTRLK